MYYSDPVSQRVLLDTPMSNSLFFTFSFFLFFIFIGIEKGGFKNSAYFPLFREII